MQKQWRIKASPIFGIKLRIIVSSSFSEEEIFYVTKVLYVAIYQFHIVF